jgi:hypothetical protein
MDKVKKFLEGYCQWLALALGAAFLGWTVYGYVVEKPVTATVGTDAGIAPGDINNEVWDKAGRPLSDDMASTQVPQNMMPTVDYPKVITEKFSQVPSDVAMDLKNPYSPYWTPVDDTLTNGPADNTVTKVDHLPNIPMLVDFMFSMGHSNVQPPKPAADQPGNPPTAAKGGITALDKLWISVGENIPVKALADSFTEAKIPTNFSIATLYRVFAEREEMDASGKWVNKVQLEPLDINPMIPLPDVKCAFQDRQNYKTWAENQQNVVAIAEPAFYTVLQGDIWYEPGFPNPNDKGGGQSVAPFDPKNPLDFKGDPNSLLPDEKEIWEKAKLDKARQDSRSNRPGQTPNGLPQPGAPGTPNGRNTGRGGRPGSSYAAPSADPQNPGDLLQPPGRRNTYQQPPPGYNPANPGPMQNPAIVMPASSVATLPQGSFSPADRVAAAAANGGNANIKVWVHDANVQAGKTYHYRLWYVISNPVAGTTNLCKNAGDSQTAWIASQPTPWGDAITVDSDSNFYAIDAKHGIRFDIFKWKNGLWQKQTVNANMGDRIGGLDPATKTDFDTGWTLVDIREDPAGNSENKVLVLVSDNGTIKEKEISIDRQNSNYRKLLGEVQATAEKTASR